MWKILLTNFSALRFLNILECFNLMQHVKQSSYSENHILDLLITRSDERVIENVSVCDPAISDHAAVFCDLLINKPPFERRVLSCRKLKSVDLNSFCNDVSNSSLLRNPSTDLSSLVDQYETVLTSILDQHAPCKDRLITVRPSAPWFNEEIRAARIKRRRLERTWRKSRLTIDRQLYVDQCYVVRNMFKD